MSQNFLYYYDSYPSDLTQNFYGVRYARDLEYVDKDSSLILKCFDRLPPWFYTGEPLPNLKIQRYRDWEKLYDVFENNLKIGLGSAGHLLAVKSGAEIFNSISGHQQPHLVYFPLMKRTFKVESAHDQAIDLSKLPPEDYEIWGYTSVSRNSVRQNRSIVLGNILEPEVVWFPKTKSLCIEFDLKPSALSLVHKSQNTIISLIVQYVLRKLNESKQAQ